MLWDGDRVIGVRTGDKGVDHDGKPKANYEPGADLLAKIVVLGEGPRGTLAKQAIARLGLDDGREPQVYAAGIKELWQLPDGRFPRGHRDSHAWVIPYRLKPSAAASSTAWRTTCSTSVTSPDSTTTIRRPIRTTSSSG